MAQATMGRGGPLGSRALPLPAWAGAVTLRLNLIVPGGLPFRDVIPTN